MFTLSVLFYFMVLKHYWYGTLIRRQGMNLRQGTKGMRYGYKWESDLWYFCDLIKKISQYPKKGKLKNFETEQNSDREREKKKSCQAAMGECVERKFSWSPPLHCFQIENRIRQKLYIEQKEVAFVVKAVQESQSAVLLFSTVLSIPFYYSFWTITND